LLKSALAEIQDVPNDVVLGDATGLVTLRVRDDQLKLCAEGAAVDGWVIPWFHHHQNMVSSPSKYGLIMFNHHQNMGGWMVYINVYTSH
jgi:hypothetical protein